MTVDVGDGVAVSVVGRGVGAGILVVFIIINFVDCDQQSMLKG